MPREMATIARPITEAALEPAKFPNVRHLGFGFDAKTISCRSSMSKVVDELLQTSFYLWYVQSHRLQPHSAIAVSAITL